MMEMIPVFFVLGLFLGYFMCWINAEDIAEKRQRKRKLDQMIDEFDGQKLERLMDRLEKE